MLSKPFYHQLTKKYILLFGNIFNNITLIQYNSENLNEIKRVKVPLIYGPKEKWIVRAFSDPDMNKALQVKLPRMTYQIISYARAPDRAQIPYLPSGPRNEASQHKSQYMGTPYDLTFQLDIYARNIDDGQQIVEQILPYFNPQYSLTANLIPDANITKDIPIILNDVAEEIDFEGDSESIRLVTWSLNFTMKVWYWGPITETSIIRKAISNIYNDPTLYAGYISRVITDNGNNGSFEIDDLVYQGANEEEAFAFAKVLRWDKNNNTLYLGGVQGTLRDNVSIRSTTSNANYLLMSFDTSPIKLAEIIVTPDPEDAEAIDDYGYKTKITEYPKTLGNNDIPGADSIEYGADSDTITADTG